MKIVHKKIVQTLLMQGRQSNNGLVMIAGSLAERKFATGTSIMPLPLQAVNKPVQKNETNKQNIK